VARNVLTFKVDGLKCPGCAGKVKAALEASPGVTSAAVDHMSGIATARGEGELSVPHLLAAITGAGYGAEPA